jgi:peptidoglycan/LPS O-acetylase OafA/YrhL
VLGLQKHGVALYVVLSVLCTMPFATASWFLVERPALGLKKRLRRTRVAEAAPAEALSVG